MSYWLKTSSILDRPCATFYGFLAERKPASLEVCALLVRDGARTDDIAYVGFSIPADFVVGYGLDVAEHYRELSSISVFEPANSASLPP